MIASLRNIFLYGVRSPAKTAFLELFERSTNLGRAIMLEEISPLAWSTVTYLWQEFPTGCHLTIQEANRKKKTLKTITERDLPKAAFANMLRQIEEAGGAGLGNFSGKVIDGVFYNLCWGNPSGLVSLSIKNPQVGSDRHQKLITTLKRQAEETSQ